MVSYQAAVGQKLAAADISAVALRVLLQERIAGRRRTDVFLPQESVKASRCG
jgi:hypothetical protein